MLALLQGTVVLARDSENNVEDDSDLVGKLLRVLRKRPASRGVSGFLGVGSMQPAATSSLMVCRPDLDFITELVKPVMMTKRSSVASDSRWGGGKTARGSSRNTDSSQYVLKTLLHNCANARASGPVAVRNVIMCR